MEVRMKRKLFIKLIVVILILLSLLSSSVLLVRQTGLSREAADFRELAAFAAGIPAAPETAAGELLEAAAQCPASASGKNPILTRYAALYAKNNDMIGWLDIVGTGIDYPVMFTPNHGDFYIDRNFKGQHSKSGSLFVDARCSFEPVSDNIIIYGHNMKNGTMFGSLSDYRDKKFFDAHPTIRFDTVHEPAEYEIVAVFYSRVYKKSDNVFKFYNFIDAENKEAYDLYISQIKAMSIYDTGVTAQYGESLVTLVTCSYHVQNGRFVVVAKKITDPDTQ